MFTTQIWVVLVMVEAILSTTNQTQILVVNVISIEFLHGREICNQP